MSTHNTEALPMSTHNNTEVLPVSTNNEALPMKTHISEALTMCTHDISFHEEIKELGPVVQS